MKHVLFLALALGLCGRPEFAGARVINDPSVNPPAPMTLSLPEKPRQLTSLVTVGQPQIHFSSFLSRTYDAESLGNEVGMVLGNVLDQSQRFTVTDDPHPQYRCKVLVNDLEIVQAQNSHNANFSAMGSFVHSARPGGSLSGLTNINLTQSTLTMTVRCAVQMQFINDRTGRLAAIGAARVDETGSTRNVALGVAGVTLSGSNQKPLSVSPFDLQSRVIELAAYRALIDLLPTLDQQLLHPPPVAVERPADFQPRPAALGREHVATASEVALTCPYCGKPVQVGEKFCPYCGKAIQFCPQCGKAVIEGAKFCPFCGLPLTQH